MKNDFAHSEVKVLNLNEANQEGLRPVLVMVVQKATLRGTKLTTLKGEEQRLQVICIPEKQKENIW